MKITCLMSVYQKDSPEYLKIAIDSILKQTRKPDEFLIIHDGPITEEQQKVLDHAKTDPIVRIEGYENNKGLGYALALGVVQSKYEVIARMDSDDIADPTRLEKQEKYLLEHPEIHLLGSNTIEFIGDTDNPVSSRIMPENHEDIEAYSHTRNPFIHPSICFYKEDVIKIGNYESWYLCEDYDLWTRLLSAGIKAHNIQENLVFMRTNEDFYKRRGGMKYCKNILRFKKHLRKKKYITHSQYMKTAMSSLIVSLSPNFVRKFIYKKMLRGKAK